MTCLTDSTVSDDDIDTDAEWVDIVEDHTVENFTGKVGPTTLLSVDAEPVENFHLLFLDIYIHIIHISIYI